MLYSGRLGKCVPPAHGTVAPQQPAAWCCTDAAHVCTKGFDLGREGVAPLPAGMEWTLGLSHEELGAVMVVGRARGAAGGAAAPGCLCSKR